MSSTRLDPPPDYRGRLAPSPTGYLHLGHARTFWTAQQRAFAAQGALVLRSEDLDRSRVRSAYAEAMLEDLRWFGLSWVEGPDRGGPCSPYAQSQRLRLYQSALEQLDAGGFIYPCYCSRKDIRQSTSAPHLDDSEPIYPGTCRPDLPSRSLKSLARASSTTTLQTRQPAWRFRVPGHVSVDFVDGHYGPQCFRAGVDFGDFVLMRQDGIASYQLAVVVDDHAMGITEVVRGADLLISTARQLLLYAALQWTAPQFYHCPLVTDHQGIRLAKRHDSLSLRRLRQLGASPDEIRGCWDNPDDLSSFLGRLNEQEP